MEYRILGKTNIKVSVIGIGTLGFARVGLYEKPDGIKEMANILNKAVDLGINIIDTAYAYGRGIAEKAVGEVLKNRRKEVIVLSRTHIWQKSDDPKETEKILEESLRNLKTDVIDIYQLHDVSSMENYKKIIEKGIYEVLKKAKKQGKVRFIGFSTHGNLELKMEMLKEEVDVLTVAYNLLYSKRGPLDGEDIKETEEKFFPIAKKYNIGLTIMKPFGGGILTIKREGKNPLSPVKLLKYIIENEYIHTVTPGVENLKQLEEIVKAGEIKGKLTEEEKKEIEEEISIWGKDFCRQCGYCLPCEKGINIPLIMRFLLRWEIEKNENLKQEYQKMQVKASECIECKKCEERCPYNLPISEKMKKAKEIFEI